MHASGDYFLRTGYKPWGEERYLTAAINTDYRYTDQRHDTSTSLPLRGRVLESAGTAAERSGHLPLQIYDYNNARWFDVATNRDLNLIF